MTACVPATPPLVKIPPLIKARNWLTHLGFEWQSPEWSHWWEELTQNHLLVKFEQRGFGLSDREVEDISFDSCVGDLETVVDALNLEEFVLWAYPREDWRPSSLRRGTQKEIVSLSCMRPTHGER